MMNRAFIICSMALCLLPSCQSAPVPEPPKEVFGPPVPPPAKPVPNEITLTTKNKSLRCIAIGLQNGGFDRVAVLHSANAEWRVATDPQITNFIHTEEEHVTAGRVIKSGDATAVFDGIRAGLEFALAAKKVMNECEYLEYRYRHGDQTLGPEVTVNESISPKKLRDNRTQFGSVSEDVQLQLVRAFSNLVNGGPH